MSVRVNGRKNSTGRTRVYLRVYGSIHDSAAVFSGAVLQWCVYRSSAVSRVREENPKTNARLRETRSRANKMKSPKTKENNDKPDGRARVVPILF